MYNPIAYAPARLVAVIAAIAMAPVTGSTGAAAQTLTEPSPPLKSAPSPAKSVATKHVKACPQYGAGFVQIAGTDACIKVGGFVDVQAGGGRH
jgi:hypothetical protein